MGWGSAEKKEWGKGENLKEIPQSGRRKPTWSRGPLRKRIKEGDRREKKGKVRKHLKKESAPTREPSKIRGRGRSPGMKHTKMQTNQGKFRDEGG